MTIDLDRVESIIDSYDCDIELLTSILQDIQAEYNYLPPEALESVSKKMEIPMIQVYRVATFFKAFYLEPRGKNIIHVCTGTACHVRNAATIINKIEQDLDLKPGETSEDMNFTLETVNCLGACALGPVMVVNEDYHGHLDSTKVDKILKNYKSEEGEG